MRIVIEIDENEVTPQSLRALGSFINTRGRGEALKVALMEMAVQISTEQEKKNPSVVIVEDEGEELDHMTRLGAAYNSAGSAS